MVMKRWEQEWEAAGPMVASVRRQRKMSDCVSHALSFGFSLTPLPKGW